MVDLLRLSAPFALAAILPHQRAPRGLSADEQRKRRLPPLLGRFAKSKCRAPAKKRHPELVIWSLSVRVSPNSARPCFLPVFLEDLGGVRSKPTERRARAFVDVGPSWPISARFFPDSFPANYAYGRPASTSATAGLPLSTPSMPPPTSERARAKWMIRTTRPARADRTKI
ncbi:hypothetical protein MRX96_035291 [Rhipicephalus microplus]